jgi:hypothetical protein
VSKDLVDGSLLEALPLKVRPLVEELMRERLVPPDELRSELKSHEQQVDRAAATRGDLDVNLAECIGMSCYVLLNTLRPGTPEESRRLIQVACRYFVETEDREGDLASVFGFDDDAEVLNAVAVKLGRPDLVVSI